MTDRSTTQASFTTVRIYAAPVARVFRAIADGEEKRKWFGGPPGSKEVSREMDFRVGGREKVSGRMDNGMIATFDCVYHDIVEDKRIICSYVVDVDGRKISVSQSSLHFQPEGQGTKFTLIEYNEFLDGHADDGAVQKGTADLFDKLGDYLKGG